MPAQTIPVPLRSATRDRSYDVHVGAFSIAEMAEALAAAVAPASGVAVLVDEQVARVSERAQAIVEALKKALPGHRIALRELPVGESCKTLSVLEDTCQWMASQGFDRGAYVVGIGGGAATDHAGFAASVYLRGINFALCPTTLLAMVDASVGGKTAVDLPAGKNLVGAFHQPVLVLADMNFLQTLPLREQAAGMAEVVKAGLIANAPLYDRLEKESKPFADLDPQLVSSLIADAIAVKVNVVSEDETEKGRRAILNFGHTLGHAMESEPDFELLHGEAVSLGMVAALKLGAQRGYGSEALTERVTTLLARIGLPVDVQGRMRDSVLHRVSVDKKRQAQGVRFVFVPRPGETHLEVVPLGELQAQAHTLFGSSRKDA